MNYHKILHDDQLNGEGLRVVVFLSGCSHHCEGCHNPQTWDSKSGKKFDQAAKDEIVHYLSQDYTDGITLSGGDPLDYGNVEDVLELCKDIKSTFPNKSIWVYTGYTIEELLQHPIQKKVLELVDVLVDGPFMLKFFDAKYPYAGSTNQRIINVKETLKTGIIVPYSID